MTTNEDLAVYAAEALAFEGTPLADHLDRRNLIHETELIAAHPSIVPYVGAVTVEESSPRLVRADAYARGQLIRFAPTTTGRYVAVHELAHVVHRRSGVRGSAHGALYRTLYADLIAAVYGVGYGDILREAFIASGLPVEITPRVGGTIRLPAEPVIPIDVLTDATREVRWL